MDFNFKFSCAQFSVILRATGARAMLKITERRLALTLADLLSSLSGIIVESVEMKVNASVIHFYYDYDYSSDELTNIVMNSIYGVYNTSAVKSGESKKEIV